MAWNDHFYQQLAFTTEGANGRKVPKLRPAAVDQSQSFADPRLDVRAPQSRRTAPALSASDTRLWAAVREWARTNLKAAFE
jgi:hypothetical protein